MRDRIQSGGLEITDYCNLKCIHCYMGDCTEAPRHMEYDKIIYFIDQFVKYKARQVIISGGEPFLHPDIELLIHNMGTRYIEMQFIIATNGSYLNDHMIEILRPYQNIQIQVSVDGAVKETHEKQHGENTFEQINYAFERMMNIPRARKIVRMTISRINYKECAQIAEFAQKYNAQVSYTYVCRVGRAYDNWDFLNMTIAQQIYANEAVRRYARNHLEQEIYDPRSVLSCPFESSDYLFGIDIHTDGNVDICTCLDNEYVIGNAYTEDFDTLLNSPKIDMLTEKVNRRKSYLRETECKGCSSLDKCSQGCIGRAKFQGNEFGLDGECEYRRALKFKNLFFFMNKREDEIERRKHD